MATRKKNLSKAQTLNRTLADIYAPSDPDPSLFDIRNNVFENVRLSQEANAKSNFSDYESKAQKILSKTPLNSLSNSKLYETNLSELSNQIAKDNFQSIEGLIPGIKSISTSPEQVKIDRQNQITFRQNKLDERARIGSETLGKIREKYGSWGEDIGDVKTSGYEDLGNTIYVDGQARKGSETLGKIQKEYGYLGENTDVVTSGYEDLGNTIYKKRVEERAQRALRSQERYDSFHSDAPQDKWQNARDAFENEQLDISLNKIKKNQAKYRADVKELNASLDKKQEKEEANRQKKLDEINDKKYGHQDISAEEKLGIRNQFQERFEDPTGMKRLTRNVMVSSNGEGGVLDKAYSSGNSSEEFGKILRNNKKAFQKGVKDKSIRGYNSDHFSQYIDDNIGKIAEDSSAEAKKAFLDYAQTVKTARTNAEEQIENTKIKLDELKENGRKVNGKTDYLKMRQSFNAEELSELTKVSGAKRARFMDTLSKGINKLSFGHLHLNNNRVLNIQNEQIKSAYDKKLKGTEERLKNQQTLLQKINDYDDTAISSSQTAKGAHKAAGRYGLTGEQGEKRATENAAKKFKNLGWKGKAGAVVGLLALGGIIGNQFAGGHQTNAQLYNPSPQPQYYS